MVKAEAGTVACRLVWLKSVVGSATPLKTKNAGVDVLELVTKFVPEAAIVTGNKLPATTVLGEMEVSVGTG